MASMEVDESNISYLPILPLPTVHVPASYDEHRERHTPLCIDNGSTHLRFGFCTSKSPRTGINMVAKYKERRTNKPLLLFGEGIDVEGGARSQAKTPWEGDVLLNFDALENALDYAFIHLGIDTPTVDHPILMTERLASPLHSRALTSELMFEQYSVPSLAFCVDSVMSFYHNNLPSPPVPFNGDGLVVSFNTASTSVIPILDGKGLMSHAKRINWGAMQATEYLLKLIQLKYPTFPSRVTPTTCNWMLQNFCEFSPDYTALLRKLKDPLNLRASERIIQFPYTLPVTEEKTEEELARIAERKKEQGRKLQELAAKSRMEKLVQKENDLAHMLTLRERREEESKREWADTLKEEGFSNDAALDSAIKKLENDLKKARKKEANEEDAEDGPPSFPLVDVPDEELDEDGLKEKKKQKLMKAGYEARERAKREKEREREERAAEERREEEERDRDLVGWASKLRKEQEAIMNRIKERNRRKAALTDRKSAASQARMKSIANLAADDRVPKKRRKAGGEDMFGADDADWAIYRKINTAAASSDEEEDLANLQTVEQKLLAYDPSFTQEDTHASLTSQRSALMSAFRPQYEEGDVQGKARIHLNIERWRVCEAWFSPSMAGVDSAGLGEVLQSVLSRFPDADKGRLVNNVFLTGGPSQFPGLADRLHATLRPILPPEMPLEIVKAADPMLDAWRGMADFAKTEEFKQVGVTRAEYEEWGGERIKRWWGGNWNSSVPI
ncbi:actin-like ATPase domain-containing protein [Lentinus tigrinus ALCF2SS1-7]|uniref:Actin-like ATPase domain-containing protein n=1 Tax=Lentinus tigrinus ALCF2SS1-6 TaxID=1328759 RepID=A0A5C2S682_9APHY|nr:actin-like ATPase domain-containing protein [Lentinus tigrinus ALCF2SS1-6]RPD68749.1 actin-like ATPase domain-containing protein [Lentinus tigrinus ALCF2SS1-7]